MPFRPWTGVLAVALVAAQDCSGGSAGTAMVTPTSAASPTPAASLSPTASSTPSASPTPSQGSPNLAALPLDDGYVSTMPKEGYVYSCTTTFGGGGASSNGPWIDTAANTFDSLTKIAVEGSVSWASQFAATVSGSTRTIVGNGLPSHATGTFPIAASDPAYAYDRNPNSIASQTLMDAVPANPTVAASPSCLNLGAIGVMLSGAQLYDALDGEGRDAQAHEILDACDGHPDQSDAYHYHGMSACIADPGTGHSNLIGYALDGFGIYGPRGENGAVLGSSSLDACHGHTHAISWNGATVTMYHYHLTYDYPYSLGCYAGTPPTR